MITHEEYMKSSGELHQQYYLEIAKACGISFEDSPKLPEIKTALLDQMDEYLNSIPLAYWDKLARVCKGRISWECKKRGTFYSFATGVCVLKAAAIDAALK